MYHALALFAVAWALTQWGKRAKLSKASGWMFLAGTLFFSGSLYLMAFTGIDLGYVTLAGGIAYMLGWISFGRNNLGIVVKNPTKTHNRSSIYKTSKTPDIKLLWGLFV